MLDLNFVNMRGHLTWYKLQELRVYWVTDRQTTSTVFGALTIYSDVETTHQQNEVQINEISLSNFKSNFTDP